MTILRVDCSSCSARPAACSDCVVSVLLGAPEAPVEFTSDEQEALQALADVGLVPPLRLVRATPTPPTPLRWAN